MLRIQELIYQIKPDVIIETGVAHGGSLVLYASLCNAIGKGKVIGIDIEIREHNRIAIEEHPLSRRIDLIEGSSIAEETISKVKKLLLQQTLYLRLGMSLFLIFQAMILGL